jgi:hypothetical protein
MTRSLICCAHGRLHEAIFFHPLGPILFGVVLIWSIIGLVKFVKTITNYSNLPALSERDISQSTTSEPKSIAQHYWVAGLRIAPFAGLFLVMGVWIARLAHVLPWPQ